MEMQNHKITNPLVFTPPTDDPNKIISTRYQASKTRKSLKNTDVFQSLPKEFLDDSSENNPEEERKCYL